jgi:serine/threonine protein kinase
VHYLIVHLYGFGSRERVMAWRLPGFDPLSHLGSGSTGAVMKARDWTSGLPVTIKYLSRNVTGADGFADQFREDAAVLVRIDSPHVAQVYGYVTESKGSAVVSEFIDGVSLLAILESGGALEPQSALYVVKGALAGLAEAHRHNVTHRDLKPANLLIDKSGITKVVDFGIAARYKRSAPAAGNPRYIAPELWVGRPATPASDVFAATAVLFETLTGAAPMSSDGSFLGKAGLSASDGAVSTPIANQPERLRTLIVKGLQAQPSERYADADEMLEALDAAAVAAYGNDWEATGKMRVVARMVPLFSERPTGVGVPRRALGAISRATAAANKGAVVAGFATLAVVAAATFAVTSGTFVGTTTNPPPVAAPVSHTPQPQIGPIIPSLSPTPGPNPDKTKPAKPTGLHVTGRSQTAITLDWNASTDNIKTVGYAIYQDGKQVGTSYTPGYTDISLQALTSYKFAVTAFDAAGNISTPSGTITGTTLKEPDRESPTTPGNFTAVAASDSAVVLHWSASHDNVGVAGYDIFRDGKWLTNVTSTGYTDHGLTALSKHTYSVRAYDTTWNASHNTATKTVTMLAGPDKTPPTAPTSILVVATSPTTTHVTWSGATDNVAIADYQVVREGVSTTATASPFDDSGLTPSQTYHYQVTTVDGQGLKSAAATYTITMPDLPVTPVVDNVSLSASPVTAGCKTTLTATVTVTGDPSPVTVTFTGANISGGSDTILSFATNPATATATVDVTGSGTVTATATGGKFDTTTVSAPDCPVVPFAVTNVAITATQDPTTCQTTLKATVTEQGPTQDTDVTFSSSAFSDHTASVSWNDTADTTGTATYVIDGTTGGSATASAGGKNDTAS